MGRSLEVIRTRDLRLLFAFFGIDAAPEMIERHRTAIQTRFALEVREIVRLCSGMPERVRFKLLREALRLSYDGTVGALEASVR